MTFYSLCCLQKKEEIAFLLTHLHLLFARCVFYFFSASTNNTASASTYPSLRSRERSKNLVNDRSYAKIPLHPPYACTTSLGFQLASYMNCSMHSYLQLFPASVLMRRHICLFFRPSYIFLLNLSLSDLFEIRTKFIYSSEKNGNKIIRLSYLPPAQASKISGPIINPHANS